MVGIWMGPRAGLLCLMAATRVQLSRVGKLHPNLASRGENQRPGCGKAMKSSFAPSEHGVASPAAGQTPAQPLAKPSCVARAQ